MDEVVTRAEHTPRRGRRRARPRARGAARPAPDRARDEIRICAPRSSGCASQVESLESRLESATGIRRPGRSAPARKRSATTRKATGATKRSGAKKTGAKKTARKSSSAGRTSTSTKSRSTRSQRSTKAPGRRPQAHLRSQPVEALMGRRVLITGVSGFWGTELARRLERIPEFEYIAGLDVRPPAADLGADGVHPGRHPQPAPLQAAPADRGRHGRRTATCCSCPSRVRRPQQLHDINVIGSLQLLAACEKTDTVRTIVVRGSAAIYGAEPNAPSSSPRTWRGAFRSARASSATSASSRTTSRTSRAAIRGDGDDAPLPAHARDRDRLAAHALPQQPVVPPSSATTRCCSSCTPRTRSAALEAAVRAAGARAGERRRARGASRSAGCCGWPGKVPVPVPAPLFGAALWRGGAARPRRACRRRR